MIAKFYYFPIRDNKLVIDMCGDSNDSLDSFRPICIGYLYVKARKLNYVELASKTFALLFKTNNDYEKAVTTLTQIHDVYSKEADVEMTNVYFTFKAPEARLNLYEMEIDITEDCLDEWDVDFRTRETIMLEIERMCELYGMS